MSEKICPLLSNNVYDHEDPPCTYLEKIECIKEKCMFWLKDECVVIHFLYGMNTVRNKNETDPK